MPPAEVAAIATEVAGRGGVCFVDEIYGELVYDAPPTTILATAMPDQGDEPFVINSFSKTFGMTGWRLGWLVCPAWALPAVERLAQNAYISPPAPAQFGAMAAFTPEVWAQVEERRAAFRARRDLLLDGLREIGFSVPVTPQGAFYVYAGSDGLDAGVAVVPGNDFGDFQPERHVRFSYTTSLDQIAEGLRRLAAWARA